MKAADRTFDSLTVGETYLREHLIDAGLVDAFAALSGDANPLHMDGAYAAETPFKKRVAHGMLLGALVSELVGMHLPGKRCLLVKESLEFHHPVFVGETVHISGTLKHKSAATGLLEIAISITRGDEAVATGVVHTKML